MPVSKTVSIPEDLGRWCDWRTYHSRRGIIDVSRKFQRKILGCAGLLIGCHSIPWPSVSRLRVTSHVLWQHLHTSYPSRVHKSVDSNLAAAREVLRVVDELLMNMVYEGQGSPNKQIGPTSLSNLQGRPILKAPPTSRSSDLPCFLFHKVVHTWERGLDHFHHRDTNGCFPFSPFDQTKVSDSSEMERVVQIICEYNIMLVCESMEACISVCMCTKSSIHCSSHLIPSTARSA
jgi:hypothetical protein